MEYRLHTSILHTFENSEDTCYVLYFSINNDIIAAAGSNYLIKIYNRKDKSLVSVLTGHKDQIQQTIFNSNNILLSCSSDRTVKIWDTLTSKLIDSINFPDEVFSIDLYNSILAVGCGNTVIIYDLANKKIIRTFDASHTTDVTKVKFHPTDPTKVVSVSIDGLICIYDLNQTDDEEAILTVINGEYPLSSFSFFGPNSQYIYTLSTQERIAIVDLVAGTVVKEFGDLRTILTEQFNYEVNYFINLDYHPDTNSLFLFAGDYSGSIFIYLINQTTGEISEVQKLQKGHTDIIRNIYWDKSTSEIISSSEDSKICFWVDPKVLSALPPMKMPSPKPYQLEEDSTSGKSNKSRNKSNPY